MADNIYNTASAMFPKLFMPLREFVLQNFETDGLNGVEHAILRLIDKINFFNQSLVEIVLIGTLSVLITLSIYRWLKETFV